MTNPTKVAIYKKTVLAASGDTIYQWQDPRENIAISFEKADFRLKLHGIIITCLKTFKGRILVGTEYGNLIIFSLSPFGENKETYELSSNSITSIRLFQGICIRATICSNKNTFIEGELEGNKFKYKEIRRNHLVQDARRIENDGTYKLCTVGLKKRGLYKQDGKEESGSLIFHDNGEDPAQIEVLDISEQGLILIKGYGGYVFLRHTSDKRMPNWIANSGGVGVSIPSQASHFVLHAGNEHPEFGISSIEPGKDGHYDRFDWQGEKYKGFISSMDHHEDQVVLGGRRSIILFNLKSVVQPTMFSQGLVEQEKMESDIDTTRETLEDASDVSEQFASELDDDEKPDLGESASESDEDRGETPDPGEFTSESEDDQGEIPDPGEFISDSENDQGETPDPGESTENDQGEIPDPEESASTSDED